MFDCVADPLLRLPDRRAEHKLGTKRTRDTEPEADRQKRHTEVPEMPVVCAAMRACKQVKKQKSLSGPN